jgi:hypothetical protein
MPQKQTTRAQRLQYFFLCCWLAVPAAAQNPSPILRWHFNEATGNSATEEIHHADGLVSGVFERVDGVQGDALRLDGETSSIVVPALKLPALGSSFTIEAWIAIDAYPWNWAPIVDQRSGENAGFLFGVDSFGHLGLQAKAGRAWEYVVSGEQLPLKRWVHVAASLSTSGGMTLFIDGKEVRNRKTAGEFIAATGQDLLIGRVRNAMLPAQWIHPKFPVWYSFDGILDEIAVFGEALNAQQIAAEYSSVHAPKGDVLRYPKLPSGPTGAGPFGAFYATLKYDELWDAPRRVAPDSDVVIRFYESPIRLVSWQGTNYIPAWVTENGKWYSDEFVESGGPGCPLGADCEPMSDKQNRYAHVRILESSPARAVIHIRYGQCEVEENVCANPDAFTGWTDVADDYYTVYPDGVAARESVAWSSNIAKIPEFQETIIINPPGTRPEDNIQTDALTFVNMKGKSATYSWEHPPAIINSPDDANIQVVNLKSEYKPFQIVFPNKPLISTYLGEKTYSMFEWWNHWPVAQVKSSGISAVAPDRPSHSSLSHIEGQPYRQTSDSVTKIMLDGLTDTSPSELLLLAKSWISPPSLTIKSGSFVSDGYDPAQRAFVLERRKDLQAGPLQMEIAASADLPLLNPCFVLEGWGDAKAHLKVNGIARKWDGEARYGTVDTLDGVKLIVWLELKTTEPISLELSAN